MKDLPPTLLCHPFSIAVQISEEGIALSFLPYSKLNFHISFFFYWRMWHICISLFSLIRICWLKVNEINSSWWHWIRLHLCIQPAHWLHVVNLTPSSAQMLKLPCLLRRLTIIRCFFLPLHRCWEICQSLVYHFCRGSISAIAAGL